MTQNRAGDLAGARVLITRAEPGAGKTAAQLSERGAHPIIAPVLHTRPRPIAADVAAQAQAIVVTSANAARRLRDLDVDRTVPVWAVGETTARAVRIAGFDRVTVTDGDGRTLADAAAAALDPEAGTVVHLRGAHVAVDVAKILRQRGFHARAAAGYEAVAVDALPTAGADALRARAADAVLFHSARGALTFARRVGEVDLVGACAPLAAAAISRAALRPADVLPFVTRRTAERPREAALLDALAEALGARS